MCRSVHSKSFPLSRYKRGHVTFVTNVNDASQQRTTSEKQKTLGLRSLITRCLSRVFAKQLEQELL